jgi:tyrosine aminotransferase
VYAGWRCGWIALHDPEHVAESIRTGLHVFANRLLGPNTLIQKALPGILGGTEKEWFDEVLVKLKVRPEGVVFSTQRPRDELAC